MIADLHTHSTASDGQHTPTELVHLAKAAGIKVSALTDHDTVDGLSEAAFAGDEVGLTVIHGVELGAKEHRNLHILGYNFSVGTPSVIEMCSQMRAERDERKFRILDFLRKKNLDISLNEVEDTAGGAIIGRPHFAQVLLNRGYVATRKEAFDRYLDTPEYDLIKQAQCSARQCVEAIKAGGGKVSLAHPYQLGYTDKQLQDLVCELKSYGLDAIECYYPRHTPQQTMFYLSLARKYDLNVTGGSDFHGLKVKPDITLAQFELKLDWLFV